MRRSLRALGTALIVAGVAALLWAVVVWRWEDPATSLYTSWQQRGLASAYDERVRTFVVRTPADADASPAAEAAAVAESARRYRRSLQRGEAVGRLRLARIGVDMVVVEGTDAASLKKGPGHYRGSALPGEHRLVYIAGHRTTYGAPFSHIDRLRPGDAVVLELPYATFEYRITGHRVVPADALEVLRPGNRELLALQACHPRFFASHRWIAYARPVRVTPKGAPAYRPSDVRAA
ncbi:MAG TPA: class E sortase [Gaiellaceae bacterium]|nr:class E sortase [Gaiellaceae bacterium]